MVYSPRGQVWTIASSGSTSDAIDKASEDLTGFIMPSAFTGTNVSFQVSRDNVTFFPLYWEGELVSFATAASYAQAVDAAKFASFRYIKIVSDGTEAAERTITPIFRRFG